jgi:hypothetical protein
MLPEYILTILWQFALKCSEDRLNNLVHHADGRTPFRTITSLDSGKIEATNFHTFGCPCYVLDHHLQSGNSMIPKWEPRAQMGLYVGRLPSHDANVSMILNPSTGHVSPQFHIVFDDDFTTVPYLRTATIPPFWAELVSASSKLHIYTEQQIDTWQSLPELTPEDGDFTSEQTEVPKSVLGTPTNDAVPFEDSEGATAAFTPGHQIVLQVVSFQDQNASENNNLWPIERQMPVPVDLHGSGLRHLSRLAELHSSDTIAAHSTKSIKQSFYKVAALALFSLLCAYGMTTTALVHHAEQKPSLLTTVLTAFIESILFMTAQ